MLRSVFNIRSEWLDEFRKADFFAAIGVPTLKP
jgi:hypothetical protein